MRVLVACALTPVLEKATVTHGGVVVGMLCWGLEGWLLPRFDIGEFGIRLWCLHGWIMYGWIISLFTPGLLPLYEGLEGRDCCDAVV